MTKLIHTVNAIVWGAPALLLILGVGVLLTVRTGAVQLILFPRALRLFAEKMTGCKKNGGVSPFQALCTALAATVGTGNLAGVAGAICIGGPGAIFWMWVSGFLGMATKYAEASLAVRFRARQNGEYVGGPMYIISKGLGKRFLAGLYAVLGVAAAFGVGNATQINAVISGINDVLIFCGRQPSLLGNLLMGVALAVLIGSMLLGGARRIGTVAERLVPFAAAGYILLCVGVLILCRDRLPEAVRAIFLGAFSPKAVTGGSLGSVFLTLRTGCARGVFTNEAGMGTASIAHAAAEVEHPVQQGLMGIMEVFLDTIVICTLTALVILCSGVSVPYGTDVGGTLTTLAFSAVCGNWVCVFIAAALCCFAFATVLGWGLYGARCAQYLFGANAWRWFTALQIVTVLAGSVLRTDVIWAAAEAVNGMMAIPNLIALALLCPELRRLTKEYQCLPGRIANGGTYANFNQRKSL